MPLLSPLCAGSHRSLSLTHSLIHSSSRSVTSSIHNLFIHITKERQEIQEEVSSLCKGFRDDLGRLQEELTRQLNGIMCVTNVMLETTKKALKVSDKIKGSAFDIISKLGKVTNVMDVKVPRTFDGTTCTKGELEVSIDEGEF